MGEGGVCEVTKRVQLEDVWPKRGATTSRVNASTGKYFDHRRRTEVNCKRSRGPERGGWDVSSGRWRGCEASGGAGWRWSETDDKFLAPSHCVHAYLESSTPCFVVNCDDVLEELLVKPEGDGLVGKCVWFRSDNCLSARVEVSRDCWTRVSFQGIESDPTGWGMGEFTRGEEGTELSELRKEFINFLFEAGGLGGGEKEDLLIIRGTHGKRRGAVPTGLHLPWLLCRTQNTFEVIQGHTLLTIKEGRSNTRSESGDNFRGDNCEEMIFTKPRNGVSAVSGEPISHYQGVVNEAGRGGEKSRSFFEEAFGGL